MFDSLEVKVLYTPTRGSVSGRLDYAQTDFVMLMRRDSGRLACLPLIRFEIHFKAQKALVKNRLIRPKKSPAVLAGLRFF
jgi:hypothetical protein